MKINECDELFMRRALTLAQKGRGRVSPNPLVGCVIVKNGKIIAEGFHKKFGGPHAEIEALKKIQFQARGATLYVTLEPCHHFGKTPPCVDAVLKAQVQRVVIAMRDPNPLTCGKSIRKLRAAGVQVTVGVCETEAFELNRFFIKHIQTKMPYVIVKVAQSLDGMISTQKGKQGWITGEAARVYVQNLRQSVDAILVGRNTVEIDDPQLNLRDQKSSQPKRVILDSELKTSLKSRLFSVHGGELIFFCSSTASQARQKKIEAAGAKVIAVQKKKLGLDLQDVLKALGGLGINSVLVEGGAQIFTSFAKFQLVDEWQFIVAPKVIGAKGVSAFLSPQSLNFQIQKTSSLGSDLLLIGRI